MAARIVENLFLCSKRWDLEDRLVASGHRWPKDPVPKRAPMSGAELVCRVLCWLDSRGDPHGRMYGVSVEELERAAQWTGAKGALVAALIATKWIDQDDAGMRWHGYGSLNRITLSDRKKKQAKRGDEVGDRTGDRRGDKQGDEVGDNRGDIGAKVGDKQGASVSESGRSSEGSPRTQSARANLGALGGPPVARREATPDPNPPRPLGMPADYDLLPGETHAERLARKRAEKAAIVAERERNLAAMRAAGHPVFRKRPPSAEGVSA